MIRGLTYELAERFHVNGLAIRIFRNMLLVLAYHDSVR